MAPAPRHRPGQSKAEKGQRPRSRLGNLQVEVNRRDVGAPARPATATGVPTRGVVVFPGKRTAHPEQTGVLGVEAHRTVVGPALPASRRISKGAAIMVIVREADLEGQFIALLDEPSERVGIEGAGQVGDVPVREAVAVEVRRLQAGAVVADHHLTELVHGNRALVVVEVAAADVALVQYRVSERIKHGVADRGKGIAVLGDGMDE